MNKGNLFWEGFREDFEKIKNWNEREKLFPYCDALLLEFKEKQVYDLSIPSHYNIYGLVNLSTRVLSNEVDKSEIKILSSPHYESKGKLKFKNLENFFNDFGLSKKFYLLLDEGDRYSDGILKEYIDMSSEIYRKEWIAMRGTWYEFREGKRSEVEKQVSEIIPKKELEKIKLLGKSFRPFIELINSRSR